MNHLYKALFSLPNLLSGPIGAVAALGWEYRWFDKQIWDRRFARKAKLPDQRTVIVKRIDFPNDAFALFFQRPGNTYGFSLMGHGAIDVLGRDVEAINNSTSGIVVSMVFNHSSGSAYDSVENAELHAREEFARRSSAPT